MKTRCLHSAAGLLAVILSVLAAAPALARNYHVSGGIQYVVQGNKERQKGNEEDARRIFGKAVAQLSTGIAEDPNDIEAWDYLGVAYAELDSAERAGWAFGQGLALAKNKPEQKKLLDRMVANREHYWVRYFNDAIRTYQKAVDANPQGDPDTAMTMEAVAAMERAVALNDENPRSYCNLAAFLANAKRPDQAMDVVEHGLTHAPDDSCLNTRKDQLAMATAERALATGEWDKATGPFERALAADPQNFGAAQRLGEIYFQKGAAFEEEAGKLPEGAERQAKEAEARQAFALAADNFGKYSTSKPEDRPGRYNLALALLRAEKFQEAGQAAVQGLSTEPDSADWHSLLSSAYRGLKLEDPANGHTLVAKTLREGERIADPAAHAKAAATKWGATVDAVRLTKELGPPDHVRSQQMGEFQVETWFWWAPKRAVLLSKGRTVSDVTFAALQTAPAPKAQTTTRKAATGGTKKR